MLEMGLYLAEAPFLWEVAGWRDLSESWGDAAGWLAGPWLSHQVAALGPPLMYPWGGLIEDKHFLYKRFKFSNQNIFANIIMIFKNELKKKYRNFS